jgi:hypothetical protein
MWGFLIAAAVGFAAAKIQDKGIPWSAKGKVEEVQDWTIRGAKTGMMYFISASTPDQATATAFMHIMNTDTIPKVQSAKGSIAGPWYPGTKTNYSVFTSVDKDASVNPQTRIGFFVPANTPVTIQVPAIIGAKMWRAPVNHA